MSIKNLLIISPSTKLGGMERASVNLANSLADRVDKVNFVSLFRQEKFFSLNKKINFFEPLDFNIYFLSFFKSVFWLRKTIKIIDPEIIIIFNKFYSSLSLLSLVFLNKKIIISERSSPDFVWPKHIQLFHSIIFTFFKPSGVLAQTNYALKKQQLYYGRSCKYKVIPNALPNFTFDPGSKEKIILLVGRLNDPLKGFDRFFEALKYVDLKNWKVIFAGGSLEDDINLYIKYSSIVAEKGVSFIGHVKKMSDLYKKASIFVIPSRSEGFPNALNEAMAFGLACISYDFKAGARDLIKNESSGLIVPEGDILKLAKAIDRVITDSALRDNLGKEASKNRIYYSQENISEQVVQFCSEVIYAQ